MDGLVCICPGMSVAGNSIGQGPRSSFGKSGWAASLQVAGRIASEPGDLRGTNRPAQRSIIHVMHVWAMHRDSGLCILMSLFMINLRGARDSVVAQNADSARVASSLRRR